MRRWLAGLLSVMILFSGSLCLAEDTESMENADIQETVVSVEGESLGTLSENIRFLKDLAADEEVRELLGMEEVKTVTSEVIWRVLVWLYQNRPVTMKILAELGIKESDRRCIEKIWDSADRIGEALIEHSQTEDGKQLQAEAEAVKNDPEIQQALVNFQKLATSEDLMNILDALDEAVKDEALKSEAVKSETAGSENSDGALTNEARNQRVDQSSFIGKLIIEAISVMDQSEWARESVPKLLKNENLWRFLTHLSGGNPELDRVFQEEFVLIAGDPEINVFFKKTLLDAQALYQVLEGTETDQPETADNEKTSEEVTP
jgi:hypothetical protein